MKNSPSARFALVFASSFAIACDSTSSGTPGTDAASDGTTAGDGMAAEGGGSDGGEGGGKDSGIDSPAEASPDSGTDATAGAETGTDGGSEGNADVGSDVTMVPPGVVTLPGYTLSVFAVGGATYAHPDSLELDGTHLWVGYNMGVKSKDGSTDAGGPLNSMVVEYNLDGSLAGKSFAIPGHCDGVRVNPATHVVWATSNEDGNPILMSYDPASGTSKTYTFTAPPGHGGGLDDMAFVNGQLVVADSSPSPDDAGVFSLPALSSIQVNGTTATFTPVLMGNAMAHNPYTNTDAPLSLSDPDSMSIDDKGNLVVVDQADSQILVIKNAVAVADGGIDAGVDSGVDGGSAAQSVTVYPVATQLDDTVWATKATGMLLVADETANTIYAVHATFTPGTIYTETPNDSSIPGIVGTLDLAGQPQPGPMFASVTPIILGLKKPTGMVFVAQ